MKSIWTNIFHKLYLLGRNVLEFQGFIFIAFGFRVLFSDIFGFMSLLKRKHSIFYCILILSKHPKIIKVLYIKKYPAHFLIKYLWAVFYVFLKTIDKLLVCLLD